MDRNENGGSEDIKEIVALRKESVDRNTDALYDWGQICKSLSARRAWIEMLLSLPQVRRRRVALRKESVDRNNAGQDVRVEIEVALRKESVDRNCVLLAFCLCARVALRKESVDRNTIFDVCSAHDIFVALRKESVDRNKKKIVAGRLPRVALRKESVDRNWLSMMSRVPVLSRSPQGERG